MNAEQFEKYFHKPSATVAGRFLFNSLKGFAEVLDALRDMNKKPTQNDTDLFMMIALNSGITIQVTGILTELALSKEGNTVRLYTEEEFSPNKVYIFSLNDVAAIQSLDRVSYIKEHPGACAVADQPLIRADEALAEAPAEEPTEAPKTEEAPKQTKTK